MKKELQWMLLILIFVPLLGTAAGNHHLDGIYIDRMGIHNIHLATDQYGILIKEGRHGEWRRFDQHSRHQYIGPRGQRLIILDHGTIKLKKRYETVTLRKRRPDRTADRWNYHNAQYGHDSQRSCDGRSYSYNRHNGVSSIDLSGVWFDHNGLRIAIDHFDDGLSVRKGQSGERAFYREAQDWGSLVIYRNTNGDTITRDRDGHLTWRGKYGHKTRHFHRKCR